jgi:hypothetical protein
VPSTSRPARDRRHVADDLTALLAQIRDLDGFQSFGLPPATGELLAQAKAGPVVTFNISSYRSDALILTETGITSLELPGLAEDTLMDQVDTFYEALSATGRPGPAADRTGAQGTLQEILGWLWEVAAGPVLQVLGYHQPPPDGTAWPRVWWVPGGLLGLLPLHAAGYHAIPPDPQHRAVLDRVVSSYTPTVGALKQAREHARASASVPGRSLIVAMPTTPGLPNLPNVAREAAMLQARLPSPVLLTEPDPAGQAPAEPDELPTRDNVLGNLRRVRRHDVRHVLYRPDHFCWRRRHQPFGSRPPPSDTQNAPPAASLPCPLGRVYSRWRIDPNPASDERFSGYLCAGERDGGADEGVCSKSLWLLTNEFAFHKRPSCFASSSREWISSLW